MPDTYFKIKKSISTYVDQFGIHHNYYDYYLLNRKLMGIEASRCVESSLSVTILKPNSGALEPPTTYKDFTIVKKISKSDFEKVYKESYNEIRTYDFLDPECYFLNKTIYVFSSEKSKNKRVCKINVAEDENSFSCDISLISSFRERPYIRRKVEFFDYEKFIKIKAFVLDYFSDLDSLKVLKGKLLNNYNQLICGDNIPLEPLKNVINYSDITDQITKRKDTLIRQLIEEDESKETRNQIRAEIKGLEYALKVIEMKGQSEII